MIGGHLDMFYGGVAVAKAAIDCGSVKAIAVTGDTRSSALPNVPTFKEAGVPEFDLASWTVMLAPKGTPTDIVALLRKETLAALDDPDVARKRLTPQGVEHSDEPGRARVSRQRARQVRPGRARARHHDGAMTRGPTAKRCAAPAARHGTSRVAGSWAIDP